MQIGKAQFVNGKSAKTVEKYLVQVCITLIAQGYFSEEIAVQQMLHLLYHKYANNLKYQY